MMPLSPPERPFMIASPYLLYLGHVNDEVGIKTSRGLAVFRPEDCVGEFRHDDCELSLGLPRMGFVEAVAAGAPTLVLGIANAGGTMGDDLVRDAVAPIEAGLDVTSGLHNPHRDVTDPVDPHRRHATNHPRPPTTPP